MHVFLDPKRNQSNDTEYEKQNLSENSKESNNESSQTIPPRNQSNETELSKCKVEYCIEFWRSYNILLFILQIKRNYNFFQK